MAKHHYTQRIFHESFHLAHAAASVNTSDQPAARLATDTVLRSLWWPYIVTEIDDTGSPPPDYWWNGARCTLAVRFDTSGVGGAGTDAFDPTDMGTIDLYPRPIPPTAVNGLHYVQFEPIEGPLVLETARKGDGVSTPVLNATMWNTDHNAVFSNPGTIYSVFHTVRWTGVSVWASDSP